MSAIIGLTLLRALEHMSMRQQPSLTVVPAVDEMTADDSSCRAVVHKGLQLVSALRYRKNLVIAIMLGSAVIGALYYVAAPRYYRSKATLLVNQRGQDGLDTSATNGELLRKNSMPTFENMVRSARVVNGASKRLNAMNCTSLEEAATGQKTGVDVKRLTVRTVRGTSILEVSYIARAPQTSASVVRAIVDSYMEFMEEMHKGATSQLSKMLTEERADLAGQLQKKQEELLSAQHRIADMGFHNNSKALHPTVQRAVSFNESFSHAQKLRMELESLAATLEDAIRNGRDIGQYVVALGNTVGREMLMNSLGLGSRSITDAALSQSLCNDRAELNAMTQYLGASHPRVIGLAERIRRAEQYLETSRDRMNQRMASLQQSQLGPWLSLMVRQRLEEARQREQLLQAHFIQARDAAIELTAQMAEVNAIERDVNRLGDMNDTMLNQIASVDLKRNGSDVRVAVLEQAAAAEKPVSPHLSMVILAILIGGFGVSVLAVNVLDALDDRFRSPEELQQRLGVPVLSSILQHTIAESGGIEALAAFDASDHAVAEGFRTLRTAVSLTCDGARRLVVTSAEPGDGKTTVLANLAVCYAQADKRTLLIDADMRRPGLTTLMGLRGPRGLSEVLRSGGDIDQAASLGIHRSVQEGLDILPSGPRPPNPAELLSSSRFSQLLAWAETAYDQILIDSPPILATSDTALVGQLVDGMLLVVRPEKNRRHIVVQAVERLTQMKAPVIGVVVNGVSNEQGHGYGYYGYHEYSGGYGGSYYGYGSDEDSSEEPEANGDSTSAAASDDEAVDDPVKSPKGTHVVIPRRVA